MITQINLTVLDNETLEKIVGGGPSEGGVTFDTKNTAGHTATAFTNFPPILWIAEISQNIRREFLN